MSATKLEKTAENCYALIGELNYQSVADLLKQSLVAFKESDSTVVDLAEVSHSDSAGVALLMEWQRLAMKKQQSIRFNNMPTQMRVIAQLSGVDKILAIS